MKRFLASLIFLCLCACLPATSSGPSEVSDAPTPPQQQHQRDIDEDASDPTTTRFAQPPRDLWTSTPTTAPARPDAPRQEAAKDRSAAPPAEARRLEPAPSPRANESAPALAGTAGGESAGRGAGSTNDDAYIAPRAEKKGRAIAEEERQGLGTSWGESRSSSVYEAPFERDSSQPTYTATMHYNDRQGASALAGASYMSSASIGMSSALTVSLRDSSGNTLSAYRGNGRAVAIGEAGQRYTIVVQNNTNERFEVLLSVDGLDVLDGQDASFGKRGYLIDAYAAVEIEGFRQSQDAVAAFRFGAVSDSYAARTGSARNVGVIGAAAFGERGYTARLRAYQERLAAQRVSSREIDRRRNADPFPIKWAEPPRDTLQLAR